MPTIARRCKGCGRTPDETPFRHTNTSDGFAAWCKACERTNRAARPVDYGKDKVCKVCGETKLAMEFGREPRNRDGFMGTCHACVSAALHAYYEANAETIKAKVRAYAHANRDKVFAKSNEYRRRNWTRIYARIRQREQEKRQADPAGYHEQKNEWARRRRRLYPEKKAAIAHRYLAKQAGLDGDFTAEEWNALRAWFGNVCLCCGTAEELTIDHVVPRSRGGRNSIDNLQVLCFSCNARKHDQTIDYRDPERLASFLASLKES